MLRLLAEKDDKVEFRHTVRRAIAALRQLDTPEARATLDESDANEVSRLARGAQHRQTDSGIAGE